LIIQKAKIPLKLSEKSLKHRCKTIKIFYTTII